VKEIIEYDDFMSTVMDMFDDFDLRPLLGGVV